MKELRTLEDWHEVVKQSNSEPVFVLKHSNTCPISASGYEAYRSYETAIPKYIVIVQTSRDISRKIAEELIVTHESPQVILLKEEKAVWHTSHYDIQKDNLENAEKIL